MTDKIKGRQKQRGTTGFFEKALSGYSLNEGEKNRENKSRPKNAMNTIFYSSSSNDEGEVSQEHQCSSEYTFLIKEMHVC